MTLLFEHEPEIRRTEFYRNNHHLQITQLNPQTGVWESVYIPYSHVPAFVGAVGDEATGNQERRV